MINNKSLRKMKKDVKAISPVVATLLLVLVAVASVTAFYLWESGWQSSQSDKLKGSGDVQYSLTVTGSTTVNEFMNQAAPAFMNKTTNYKVTVESLGSGIGLKAIEQGTCDIGMISDSISAVDSTALANYPNLVGTTIGYDGVVVFIGTSAAAYHTFGTNAFEVSAATAKAIYGTSTTVPTILTWAQLETAMGWTAAMITADIHSADNLNVHYRSDSSGTQDAFAEKYMGTKGYFATTVWSGYAANVAYNFVGSTGNTGIITDVAADHDAIGFTSYGIFSTSANVKAATMNNVAPSVATIKAGVSGASGGFSAVRPLILVTMGEPSGAAKVFIDFCTDATNNQKFCASTGYVSLYA